MSASQTSRETSSRSENTSHVAEHESARAAPAEHVPAPNPHTAQPPTAQTVGISGVHPEVARTIGELIAIYGMPHVEQAVKEAKGQGSSY